MMKFLRKKKKRKLPLFFGTLILLYSFFDSIFFYKLGNLFFGGSPKLYNITLAHAAFYQASHPLFGKPAPYAHHQLSRTYFIQGKLDSALTEAYKELEIYPENKTTNYVIGLTLGYMNKEKEAIDAFSKYIQYNPKTWAARNDKAWLQFRIGDIDGAVATLEPVIEKQDHNVWVQNTYCALMINKKRYDEAKKACLRASNVVNIMTEETWGKAYPGNDPRIYAAGLQGMKASIAANLELLEKK
jgi:tetratricopeptide (TPR) repeat protein